MWFWSISTNSTISGTSNKIIARPLQRFPLDRKKCRLPIFPLTLVDQSVPFKKEIKYMRVNFDDKFYFRTHILKARQRAIASAKALRSLLGKSSKLTLPTKRLLIIQVIIPTSLYGRSVWSADRQAYIFFRRRQITRAIKLSYGLQWRTPTFEVYLWQPYLSSKISLLPSGKNLLPL